MDNSFVKMFSIFAAALLTIPIGEFGKLLHGNQKSVP
jgi:hypothetical protein